MEGRLPSVLRVERTLLLVIWGGFILIHASLLWRARVPLERVLAPEWLGAAAMLALAGLALSLLQLQAAWRLLRALRRFAAGVSGRWEVSLESLGEVVVRWPDLDLEVRGMTGYASVDHLEARLGGERWRFQSWAGDVVAREVRSRLGQRTVGTPAPERVPWGLGHWMSWATPLFMGMAAWAFTDLLLSPRWALPAGAAGTLLGYVLIVWGRVVVRHAMARFADALVDSGLAVDGPYLAEAGFGPRYVCFTPAGSVSVYAPAFGALAKLIVRHRDVQWQGKPRHADRIARQVAGLLEDPAAEPEDIARLW